VNRFSASASRNAIAAARDDSTARRQDLLGNSGRQPLPCIVQNILALERMLYPFLDRLFKMLSKDLFTPESKKVPHRPRRGFLALVGLVTVLVWLERFCELFVRTNNSSAMRYFCDRRTFGPDQKFE
jgi:hypothetical protein